MNKVWKIKVHADVALEKRKGSVFPESGEMIIGDYIAKESSNFDGKKVTYNVWRFLLIRNGAVIKSHIPVGRFNRVFFSENADKEQIEHSFDGAFVDAYLASDSDTQQSVARAVIPLADVEKVQIEDSNFWFASLNPKGYWEDADTLLNLVGEDVFNKVAPILFDSVEDTIKVDKTEAVDATIITDTDKTE